MPSSTDTYVIVDANGNVSFDFTGHVRAEGLDLPSLSGVSPPEDSRISWLRQSDGALIAEIFASDGIFGVGMSMQVKPQIAAHSADLQLGTSASPGNLRRAYLDVRRGATDAATDILAIAENGAGASTIKKVIGADGASHFAQLKNSAKMQMQVGTIFGLIMPAGLGVVFMNLPSAWLAAHTVVLGTIFPGVHNAFTMQQCQPSGLAQIYIVTTNTGAAQNFDFNFVSFGAD